MIRGTEPNIRRLMSPEDRAREEAKQREAEAEYSAEREKTEQLLFSKWLKNERKAGTLYWINPRSDVPSTIECGHPDYTIWVKGYAPILIEMKAEGGKLSADQLKVIGELEALEHHVYVAWNHVQASNIVEFYLSNSIQGQHDRTTGQTVSQERYQELVNQRHVQATASIGVPNADVARPFRSDSAHHDHPKPEAA